MVLRSESNDGHRILSMHVFAGVVKAKLGRATEEKRRGFEGVSDGVTSGHVGQKLQPRAGGVECRQQQSASEAAHLLPEHALLSALSLSRQRRTGRHRHRRPHTTPPPGRATGEPPPP